MRSFAAAAVIKAITALVTGPPNLVGFDFADLRLPCISRAVVGTGRGRRTRPQKTNRKMDTHEEKLRQLKDEFKYETDEELKRKREVYRSHIVRKTTEEIAQSEKT